MISRLALFVCIVYAACIYTYTVHIAEQPHDLYIHIIYNKPKSLTFNLRDRGLARLEKCPTTEHLILGDMNVTDMDVEGTALLEIMDCDEIELVTEEGLVTWERGQLKPTIDLTFLSANLLTASSLWNVPTPYSTTPTTGRSVPT